MSTVNLATMFLGFPLKSVVCSLLLFIVEQRLYKILLIFFYSFLGSLYIERLVSILHSALHPSVYICAQMYNVNQGFITSEAKEANNVRQYSTK